MKTLAALALVTMTALGTGCAATADSTDTTSGSSEDELTSQQNAAFAGTWDTADATTLPFYAYTFSTDGTYSAIGGCRPNPKGPSCFAISHGAGKWTVKTSGPQLGAPGGALELVLTSQFDGSKDTYFYTMKNDKLSLRTSLHGTAQVLEHEPSTMKKLRSGQICADKNNNSLGQCPEDLPCLQDGPTGNVQRCLPQI